MPHTVLSILDQCNVRFNGLDPSIRNKMKDALKFLVPGARYMPSVKLGRWDGMVTFCTQGGSSFLNLVDRLIPIVKAGGYEIKLDDRRPTYQFEFPEINETLFADRLWPVGHQMAGEPIILRDYQVDAVRTFIDNPQSIQVISTGAGKTILAAALSYLVEPHGRSIIVVPSKSLVTQTEEDYRNLGLDVGVLFGERKEWGHQHTIATWQSLASLHKQGTIAEFVQGVICVINDEVHTVRGKLLKELLTGPLANVPIRWGFTGTIPKEEHEALCLLVAIGPVAGEVRTIELQEKGVLANYHVEVVQLHDDHVGFRNYHSEHDFLVTDRARLHHIAHLIESWVVSGNTLVLVDRIETGEMLLELLPDAVFISGPTKLKTRQKEYKSIQTDDQRLIIATYGVASVGINLPRIFNLVLLESGRSFIKVLQSIGRILRRAHDKDHANVYDICSSLKFSKRHLVKRREYYEEAQCPTTTIQVHY